MTRLLCCKYSSRSRVPVHIPVDALDISDYKAFVEILGLPSEHHRVFASIQFGWLEPCLLHNILGSSFSYKTERNSFYDWLMINWFRWKSALEALDTNEKERGHLRKTLKIIRKSSRTRRFSCGFTRYKIGWLTISTSVQALPSRSSKETVDWIPSIMYLVSSLIVQNASGSALS